MSPVELCTGLSISWCLHQIWAEVSTTLKVDFLVINISKHAECNTITLGTFRSTTKWSCRVREHIAYYLYGLWGGVFTWEHLWGRLQWVWSVHDVSEPIDILLLLLLQHLIIECFVSPTYTYPTSSEYHIFLPSSYAPRARTALSHKFLLECRERCGEVWMLGSLPSSSAVSPQREAFRRWQTLSLWKLWLIEGSRSVEALASTRLKVCGSFDPDVDVANLLV
jgi:hypothetical protein